MKTTGLNRRDFLRTGFRKALDTVQNIGTELVSERSEPRDSQPSGYAAIQGDLPPELLAFEAERLGLSPDNREAILEALQREMGQQER